MEFSNLMWSTALAVWPHDLTPLSPAPRKRSIPQVFATALVWSLPRFPHHPGPTGLYLPRASVLWHICVLLWEGRHLQGSRHRGAKSFFQRYIIRIWRTGGRSTDPGHCNTTWWVWAVSAIFGKCADKISLHPLRPDQNEQNIESSNKDWIGKRWY